MLARLSIPVWNARTPLRLLASLAVACSASHTASEPSSVAKAGLETPASVYQVTRSLTTSLVSVRTSRETLVTTPDYPIATVGKGWTPAGRLAIGDVIVDRSLRGDPVLAVHVQFVAPTEVYNLTLSKSHSYWVGKQGLLVHNVDGTTASKKRPEPWRAHHQHEAERKRDNIRQKLARQRR